MLAYRIANRIVRTNKDAGSRSALAARVNPEVLPKGVRKKDIVALFDPILKLRSHNNIKPRELSERVKTRLVKLAEKAITERSLSIPAGYNQFPGQLVCRGKSNWLVNFSGYYKYSSRFGTWHQSATYFCGREDGQLWAVRVPSTIKTLHEAERWLMPSDVKAAADKGATVIRQGDFYFIKKRIKEHDFSALRGSRHEVEDGVGGLIVKHPEHPSLLLDDVEPGCWRAYQQQQLDGSSRRAGD